MWDYTIGMRTHIWIRKENEAKWEEIMDKSEWINERLSVTVVSDRLAKEIRKGKNPIPIQEGDMTELKAPVNDIAVARAVSQLPGVCKHGAAKGFCKFGCK